MWFFWSCVTNARKEAPQLDVKMDAARSPTTTHVLLKMERRPLKRKKRECLGSLEKTVNHWFLKSLLTKIYGFFYISAFIVPRTI